MDTQEIVEPVEHRVCRQRTEEEDRAVDMCTVMRVLLKAGAHEINLNQGR